MTEKFCMDFRQKKTGNSNEFPEKNLLNINEN